jgi:hypothetical protein
MVSDGQREASDGVRPWVEHEREEERDVPRTRRGRDAAARDDLDGAHARGFDQRARRLGRASPF